MTNYLLVFFSLLLISCNPLADTRELQKLPAMYFSVDSLLEAQQGQLMAKQFRWIKKAQFEQAINVDTLKLDSINIRKELELLRELDINESWLRNQYVVTRKQEDDYMVTTYQTNKPDKIGVNYLKVSYKNNTLEKVYGKYRQSNYLYTSERTIGATFKQGLISTITVQGGQKMIFRPPMQFSLEGSLLH